MKLENSLKKIEMDARKISKNLGPSHDWSHVERVANLAVYIAEREGANVSVVKAASYLHDIGRHSLKEVG
jgi:uncharacterized protein